MTENVYEVASPQAHQELDYALASGAAAVSYDVANQPSSLEYAISDPTDQGEEVYTMASGMSDTDVVYDIGGVGGAIESSADVVYDMGGSSARHGADQAIYDNQAGKRLSEAVYDFGSAPGATDDDDGAIYDNNPAALLQNSGEMEDDVVYDIGSNVDGYLGIDTSTDGDIPHYDQSSAGGGQDAVYDIGNAEVDLDATYHSRQNSQKSHAPSDGYVTLPRSEPVLVPEVYSPGPTYDLGGGANAPTEPVATYELADSTPLDPSMKLRSRSYDNALNDAAA